MAQNKAFYYLPKTDNSGASAHIQQANDAAYR